MKKFLLTIICFWVFTIAFSQEQNGNITISFEKETLYNALIKLEAQEKIRFYFAEEWIPEKVISSSFNDVNLTDILGELFKETLLNFYELDNTTVVITRNNIIYDSVPEGFFGKEIDTTAVVKKARKGNVNPIFFSGQKTVRTKSFPTVRIGRESAGTGGETFELRGKAINLRTGNPIANLTILEKSKNIFAVTNDEGEYRIELPVGVNLIETKSLGIEDTKRNIVIYNNGNFDFMLDESIEQLDEVVLEANVAKNVEEASTGNTKIDNEESKNIPLVLGERNILKVATALPGITTAGEGATGYNVRGGKADQNLILLDQAVIYNPTHFFGIFEALNPFTTKEANIYKGNIPVEYGGRLSSVFDITSKDASVTDFKGEASIGPVTSNLALEVPVIKDKSGFLVGGRGAYSNWILRSLDEENLQNSEASFYDVVAKYNHNINENNDLQLSGYFSNDRFSITSDSIYGYTNRLISAKWRHKFNDNTTADITVANSQYQFDIEFDTNSINDFDLGFKVEETAFKYKMKSVVNSNHTLDYGVSGKLYSLNPGKIEPRGQDDIVSFLEIPEERAFEGGIFLADKFKVSDKLLFDVGLRYSFFAALGASDQRIYQENVPRSEQTLLETRTFDKNEVIETYGGPEIRAGLRYLFTKDFSVKASFNNSYQFIHLLSNNTTISPIDTWKLSDINIKPQQANQYSLGFYKNFNGNDFELSLEGFYKDQKNILDFKTGAKLLLNETIETEVLQGEGQAYGAELLIRKNAGKLNGWLSYTYSRSFFKLDSEFDEERVNNGKFFPSNFDKPHDISLVTNYKFTRRFSLSTNFVYQTGRPVTFPVGNFVFNGSEFVLFSDRNQFRIPDYFRLDLGFNVEGNHKKNKLAHSFWTFSIYNVFGRNNPYSVFFVTEGGEIRPLKSSIFAIPVPSITYNFKF